MNHEEKRSLIVPSHKEISLSRQSALLGVSRESFYYKPIISPEDIRAMNAIDEVYTAYPFYGSRRMKPELESRGISIGRHHIRRLMRKMGLEAVYPKPRLSIPNALHEKYPYLLSEIKATYSNHIWGTDITYIRLEEGFAYLTAISDWFFRYVVSFEIGETLETKFCLSSLNKALEKASPLIHNSDQGVQFTSEEYTGILKGKEIKISMDGRGRCMDNIFTERLWRTVKYEDVYLKSYRNIEEAKNGLSEYFSFYNGKRRHQSLDYRTPEEVYFKKN